MRKSAFMVLLLILMLTGAGCQKTPSVTNSEPVNQAEPQFQSEAGSENSPTSADNKNPTFEAQTTDQQRPPQPARGYNLVTVSELLQGS